MDHEFYSKLNSPLNWKQAIYPTQCFINWQSIFLYKIKDSCEFRQLFFLDVTYGIRTYISPVKKCGSILTWQDIKTTNIHFFLGTIHGSIWVITKISMRTSRSVNKSLTMIFFIIFFLYVLHILDSFSYLKSEVLIW